MVNKAEGIGGVHKGAQASSVKRTKKEEPIGSIHDGVKKNTETEEPKQSKAELNFKNDLKNGKLKESKGRLFGVIPYDNYVYTPTTDKKTGKRETLGQIRTRYNLPEGTLKKYVPSGGGNFDKYEAPAEVVIDAETLRQSVLATQ